MVGVRGVIVTFPPLHIGTHSLCTIANQKGVISNVMLYATLKIDSDRHTPSSIVPVVTMATVQQQLLRVPNLLYLGVLVGVLIYWLFGRRSVPKGLRRIPGPKGLPLSKSNSRRHSCLQKG